MWLQANQPRKAGCIGLYQTHNSLIDNLIVLRTGSLIVHAAIFDSQNSTIAATSQGITRNPSGEEYAVWWPTGDYDAIRLNDALEWLNGQVGLPYGYADIVNQVLSLGGKDSILLDKSSDCSDLATKFLWIAGVRLPADFIKYQVVTPGGLYKTLDAIP